MSTKQVAESAARVLQKAMPNDRIEAEDVNWLASGPALSRRPCWMVIAVRTRGDVFARAVVSPGFARTKHAPFELDAHLDALIRETLEEVSS